MTRTFSSLSTTIAAIVAIAAAAATARVAVKLWCACVCVRVTGFKVRSMNFQGNSMSSVLCVLCGAVVTMSKLSSTCDCSFVIQLKNKNQNT